MHRMDNPIDRSFFLIPIVNMGGRYRGIKSNYRVAVGRSKKVAGPYLDKEGRDMRNGGGTLLLEGDKKEYEAMGHSSAYSFPDGDFFFCHGYSIAKNGASILVQKRICWTEDGWLTLE